MYNFKRVEQEVLEFWHKNHVFEKSLALRQAQSKKHFVFFEGPPTANGRPHIGHFLTRVYKDLYGRYKTMRGFFVLRKAGWDTHGLPVEIEIEKELGFKSKKDIENYGIDKFNKKAKESVWKYKTEWEEMTRKMGFWLDIKDPYVTYENDYIESLWSIIKKIWDKELLYLAHKVVHFCTRCGTPLSSHEVAQGYKKVTDKSVYVKFSAIGGSALGRKYKNTYILAWTTTPWTLPGNVALAVRASITYQVVSIKGKDERYILAKDLVSKVFNTEYTIHNTILGSDLVGLEYKPLFDIPELKSKTSYKVYDADFVSMDEGTGIVHTAVMYGEDDYNLGAKLDLPKFHTVDEAGKFIHVGMDFDGLPVKHKDKKIEEGTTGKIIEYLDKQGLLFKIEEYEHDYPFCWRCDSPLLYYAKNSWFIKMSSVGEQLLKNNKNINWFPEHIKEGRFGQWLKEGKDWAISRERYWGTPLPIWKCQKCGNHRVIGSVAELEKYGMVATTKKNTYYMLRHGYTTRDEKKKMIISSELKADKYHLTEDSIKHIENSVESIKNNHKIDFIYSSPFIRTMETAEIVAKTMHIKIYKDDRLGEIKHGGCEGNPHSTCPFKDAKHTMDDKHHEMGESWNDVRLRMVDFMGEMESKHSGKSILIVSHGDPLWLLNNIGIGSSAEDIIAEANDGREYYLKPGEFQRLDWRLIPRNNYGELDLHRPQIDSVYLKCSDCGALMKKIPDLIDVWFDSGSMPYAQWHWPFENKKMFEDQFPADFIVEAVDQTRGWFYTLLAISTLLGRGNPYKNVMSLGHVLDEKGKKMSKSKGNVVSPFEVMDKVGADAARWYFYSVNSPGEYKNFSMRDVESKLKGFIFTLQNCIRFYELYRVEHGTIHPELARGELVEPVEGSHLLDQWILSKFQGLIAEASDSLDKYDPTTGARAIEKFVVEDLSNWWLRRSRKRKEALGLLRFLLLELAKILAPFTPFLAEDIHMRMHRGHKMGTESVHLHDWPAVDKKLVNKKLEEEMDEVRSIVTAGLAARKEKQMKVRQPLAKLTLGKAKSQKLKAQSQLLDLIKEEVNIKDVVFDEKQEEEVVLDLELSALLINEGYARELIRQIQDMRKEAKYKLDQKVSSQWHSDDGEVSGAIHEWTEEIKKEALLKEFFSGPAGKKTYDVEKEFELVPQKKIWMGVRK